MGRYVYVESKKPTKDGDKKVHLVADIAYDPPKVKKFGTKRLALGWLKHKDQ